MTETQQRAPVYAAACEAYRLAGWTCVIPVPPESKFPPPGGFTGAGGRDTAEQDIAGWAASRGADSIALRMPDGLIGIDVDEYVKDVVLPDGTVKRTEKHGAAVVAAAESELGPLPPTYTSTARGDGQSGIRFYRVPPGRYAAQLGPDVEIIQRHHRYAVVAPSPHAGAGADYRWYAPDGSPLDGRVPGPGDMTELPPAWADYLAAGASAAGPAASGRDDGMALLDWLLRPDETACVAMAAAASTAVTGCTAAEAGSRHDAMTRHTYEVVQLAAEGHPGCAGVLDALRELWDRLTAGEDRGAEFGDMLLGAARKAVTAHGPAPARADACLFANALRYDAPAPGSSPGSSAPAAPGSDPVEPPRWWSPFGAIGAEPFDPAAELDAPLARDVLARTWPVLRYAPDAGSWIVRGPDRWDVRKGDLAKWAVDLVSWLMLPGDPGAPEGSDDWRRARKRARLTTNASSNGIAGKMNAQVTAGHHPSAVELAELDGEREVLWAGGVAYDLRLSAEHPEPSRTTDPGTPHLHSAGVIPRTGPTPLWDSFLAAVWPDEELRAWALRVLSIAVTGYSDKALPIMLGETDRGKALALDTPVPVPSGWTTMGELKDGDTVYDETGKPCRVARAWPVRHDRPCYEVEFSDGSVITADAEHLWYAETARSRRGELPSSMLRRTGQRETQRAQPVVITTEEMARTLRSAPGGRLNYSIPVSAPLQGTESPLPVPPYTLGAWLGDGTTSNGEITSADPDIIAEVSQEMAAHHATTRPSLDEISGWPAEVTVAEAARALGLRKDNGYWLIRQGRFPARVIRYDGAPRDTNRAAVARYRARRRGDAGAPPVQEKPFRIKVDTASLIEALNREQYARIQPSATQENCETYGIRGLNPLLREAGVLGNKHIPEQYQRAPESQRRALLAGLLDTDGGCTKDGTVEFYSAREQLARDVYQLVCSLGYKARLGSKRATLYGKDCGTCWTVRFHPAEKVFRLPRKLARQNAPGAQAGRRYVTAIRPVPSVPVRCITVDSPSHLYLAGEACIPTHNTSVIDLMMSVLGSYAHTADARLLSPADRSHASIVFALKGRRLSFIDEAPRAGTMAQERLKQITGGADLTANRMNENPVTFPPTHTLILTANPEHEPNMLDAAIRRRVRLIPCEGDPAAVIAARAAIGNLNGPHWRREAPGVLAALMAEAAGWLADPRSADSASAPESGRAAALEIQESQDYTLNWVREECEPWQQGTKAHQLYEAFTESCKRKNIHPSQIPSEKAWALRVNDLGYDLPRRHDGKYKALRVRLPQGFMPSAAEITGTSGGSARPEGAPVQGSAISVHGGAGSVQGQNTVPETLHNGRTPGKTLHNPTLVQGVQGDSLSLTHTHTHTRTCADPSARYTPTHPAPGTETPAADPVPAEAAATPEPSPAVAKTRKAKAPLPRPDPELEGPVHPLPVIVARDPAGGPPRVVPCSPDDARLLAEAYLDALCADCETTGYPPGHADFALRTVQLGGEQVAAVLDPADPAQAAVITDLLARARGLHAHSAAADLVPLAAAGLGDAGAMWAKMTDSVLVVKLADPALAGSDENQLKKLADDVLPAGYAVSPPAEKARSALFKSGKWLTETTPLTPRDKSGWAQVKPGCETMARYAGSDVLDLAGVLRVLPQPDPAVLARERAFQAMCARVSHQGFRLDPEHIKAKITEYESAREAARQRVEELSGITNPSSTKDVPARLAEMGVPLGLTADGNPSAAKAELEPLAADPAYEHHELLRSILDYRHDVTTLGLLLEPLNVLCEHGDGRMRPVVYTIEADTGRTSCRRPNGQQFSRQGGIRACVIADDAVTSAYGVAMAGASADFKGAEIRVGAALSGDLDLLRAETSAYCLACSAEPCTCGQEQSGLHWMAARMAFGPGAAKEDRYNCKRIIFSKMFGGGPKSGARQVGIAYEASLAIHRAFEQIAPRFAEWDRQMRAYADAGNRAFMAYSGRTVWLPRGRSHAAGNYAIQGTARELLVDGVLKWGQTRWGRYPLLPIHDELLVWIPQDEAAEALETLKECMRNEIYDVPIVAEGTGPFQAWPDSS